MKKQVRLLIETIFNDIYDIDQENNSTIDIADEHLTYTYFPETKNDLQIIIKDLLNERGTNANLNDIDTSQITDMSDLFNGLNIISNINISRWNVDNVKNMNHMFAQCQFFNCNLNDWNVSNVENMSYMFSGCTYFNSNLSKWNICNVHSFCGMFFNCFSFSGNGLDKWLVDTVKNKIFNMNNMFYNCVKFNCNLNNQKISPDFFQTINMFKSCSSLKYWPKWFKN